MYDEDEIEDNSDDDIEVPTEDFNRLLGNIVQHHTVEQLMRLPGVADVVGDFYEDLIKFRYKEEQGL